MIFSVKIRSLPKGDWVVYNNVQADSFSAAERKIKRSMSTEMGLPESAFDTRAYRSDSKSVWGAK